jgi:polyadenylate-binding protein
VGDLASEITETRLYEIFSQVGPVASIRVCRDAITRRSLGYAYINYHSVLDAERALDTLNNFPIKGRPCRIMWSQRDPSIRRSGVGNIFIKSLDNSISHKELYDTFSAFGNILSCKVSVDENGGSKGYGFVHFESAESAEKAIQKVNGMMLGNMKVYVGRFIGKKEWLKQKENSWTNVFVKNLPPTYTEQQLHDLFSTHGTVTSSVVMKEPERPERPPKAAAPAAVPTPTPAPEGATPEAPADGVATPAEGAAPAVAEEAKAPLPKTVFGFINFKNHEDAVKAVEAVNGSTVDGRELFCGRAQKKTERQAELRKKFEQLKLERMTKYQGINLYIKNLEDDINEERLRKEFGAFGKIKSIKIVDDGKGNSRGFGFVCFTTPEEANRATTEMNGRILSGCTKPLYVNLHEPKEMRRQKLAAQYAARKQSMRVPPGGPVPQQGPGAPLGGPGAVPFAPYPYGPQGPMPGQGFVGYPANVMPPRGGGARWAGQPQQPFPGQPGPGGVPGNYVMPGPQRGGMGGPPRGGRSGPQGPSGPHPRGGAANRGPARPPQGAPAGPQANGGPAAPAANPQQEVAMLVQHMQQFSPDQQKMFVGERLYPLIHKREPQLAGKITGMLLESSFVDELVHLLENEEARTAKIEEAKRVLEEAQKNSGEPKEADTKAQ